jgi:hypothetical protein
VGRRLRDKDGKRRLKTCNSKREAVAESAKITVDVRAGTHTADRASSTIAKAAEMWLARCKDGSPDQDRSSVARTSAMSGMPATILTRSSAVCA